MQTGCQFSKLICCIFSKPLDNPLDRASEKADRQKILTMNILIVPRIIATFSLFASRLW
jgi:hypothetical protein